MEPMFYGGTGAQSDTINCVWGGFEEGRSNRYKLLALLWRAGRWGKLFKRSVLNSKRLTCSNVYPAVLSAAYIWPVRSVLALLRFVFVSSRKWACLKVEFLYFLFKSSRTQQHRLLHCRAVLPGLLQTQESISCSVICPVFRITKIWTVLLLTQGLHNILYRTAALILLTEEQKNPCCFLPPLHTHFLILKETFKYLSEQLWRLHLPKHLLLCAVLSNAGDRQQGNFCRSF